MAIGDAGEDVHLVGGEAAVGYLDPHHVLPGLSLAVDAVLKAEGAEGIAKALAVEEGPRLTLKLIELRL
jgi:hypothetical protein